MRDRRSRAASAHSRARSADREAARRGWRSLAAFPGEALRGELEAFAIDVELRVREKARAKPFVDIQPGERLFAECGGHAAAREGPGGMAALAGISGGMGAALPPPNPPHQQAAQIAE